MQTQQITSNDTKASKETSVARDPKKWKVAQEFESMFIQQMFSAMRKTVPDGGMTEESHGREIFTDMLDSEMSKRASKQGGFGLADMVYRQLTSGDRAPTQSVPASASIPWKDASAYSRQARPGRATAAQVESWTQEAAKTNGIDPALLKSLVRNESAGDSLAVSRAGAQGLTQLMPGTARDMGVSNPLDGRQNVMGGARYLRKLLDQFDGREDLALAAYNAGPGNVVKHGGIPPFAETQSYVKKVLDGRKQIGNTEVNYAS